MHYGHLSVSPPPHGDEKIAAENQVRNPCSPHAPKTRGLHQGHALAPLAVPAVVATVALPAVGVVVGLVGLRIEGWVQLEQH